MSNGYYEAFEIAMGDVISGLLDKLGITDVPTILSYGNGLEPQGTYCVLDILEVDQQGRANKGTFLKSRDEEVLETMSHYRGHLQVSVIGKKASSVASAIHHHISNNQIGYDILAKNGVGLLSKSGMRKIPQQRETQWVDSFNMDLNVSFAVYTVQSYDWVEFITINGHKIRIYNE